MSQEEKERLSKIPQKADIIVMFSFTLSLFMFFCVFNKGDNGIFGNFLTYIFNKLFFVKYLVCSLPIELGIKYYRYQLYKHFYQKPYILHPPLIVLLIIIIHKLCITILPKTFYSILQYVKKKRRIV